jgi:putative hydrolase of HD superfamily
LPEAVTRDIISPVKQATRSLPDVVKRIESEFVAAEILPSVDDYFKNEILYFIDDEFENRIQIDGKTQKATFQDLNEKYNSDEFSPLDGELIRLADHTAAFLEADSSIKYGITSAQLQEGRDNLRKIYAEKAVVSEIKTDFFNLF